MSLEINLKLKLYLNIQKKLSLRNEEVRVVIINSLIRGAY